MDPSVIARILEAFGTAYVRILPAIRGYRNASYPIELPDGHYVNLLVYKREPDILVTITHANWVSGHLAAAGYPARSLYDPRVLQLKFGERLTYSCLYRYLPGATIPWEAYTKEHLKLLGKAMSDMHSLLLPLDDAAGMPHVAHQYLAITSRMQTYFADSGVKTAMRRKLGLSVNPKILPKMTRLLTVCQQLQGGQALHMDFVRGNILFDDSPTITGVLDFEKTAYGHPAFDIARTLAFLLVDCKYKPADKVRKYFLHSGYQKRGHAPLPPTKLIDALVPVFLLYDFYKFLRHNPYESLSGNEHYLRTRDILRRRKMLE